MDIYRYNIQTSKYDKIPIYLFKFYKKIMNSNDKIINFEFRNSNYTIKIYQI